MSVLLSSRILFTLGFVILIATNIAVLSGVASNRTGEPETLIRLTERELQLSYHIHEENSGLALRLVWRSLGKGVDYHDYAGRGYPVWFDSEKLKVLGFNIDDYLSSMDTVTFYKKPLPKEVFIVLEYNGDSYRETLKRAEQAFTKEQSSFKLNRDDKKVRDHFKRAEIQLDRERLSASRLFAIDAGLDPKILRKKYSDRARFIITQGVVVPGYYYIGKRRALVGIITELSIKRIHVPLKHRKVFDTILSQGSSRRNGLELPRYSVELAYGSRLEPWVLSVQAIDDKSD